MTTKRKARTKSDVPSRQAKLAAFVHERYLPSGFLLPPVESLHWGDTDLSQSLEWIRVEREQLNVRIRGSLAEQVSSDLSDPTSKALRGRFTDGGTIQGDAGLRAAGGWQIDAGSSSAYAELSSDSWMVSWPGRKTVGYVAAIDRDPRIGIGNLTLVSRRRTGKSVVRSSSMGHLYLRGARNYALLWAAHGADKRWFLVAFASKAKFEPMRIADDILALQFSLGQSITVPAFEGLDQHGVLQSIHSSNLGRPHLERPSWCIPVSEGDEAALFNKVSNGLNRESERQLLIVALSAYLASFSLGLSLGEIVLLEAISRLARSLAPGTRGRYPRRVAAALEEDLPQDWTTALRSGGTAGSQGLDSADAFKSAIERGALLRAVLVALVSKIVDFRGALGISLQHSRPEGQWRQGCLQDRERWAAVGVVSEPRAPMWPQFSAPQIPTSGPLADLSNFADLLALRNGGRVAALFRPVPAEAGESLSYEFKLFVTSDPTIQTDVFTVVQNSSGGFLVQGFGPGDIDVSSEANMSSFMDRLATDDEFRVQVERLLMVSEELGRGW